MESDVFFITYDEPAADLRWERLREQLPKAQRVHGVKGFDAAYKACAALSRTNRFFTVDGDNELIPAFHEITIEPTLFESDAVLSWSAKNSINGLCYGNGGIKNWPRDLAHSMKTHEAASSANAAVDFCFQLNYFQMPETLSVAMVNGSPYQAFRAGFREGVKMCLERGARPPLGTENLAAHLWQENLNRLRIWCSVGADVPEGKWAMLGARLGCQMLCLTDWDHQQIRDYDWFEAFWREEIEGIDLECRLDSLERELNERLSLGIITLGEEASRFFKSAYVNPPRQGRMFK